MADPKVIYRTADECPLYVCPERGIKKSKYMSAFEAYWQWVKERAVIFDESSKTFVDFH